MGAREEKSKGARVQSVLRTVGMGVREGVSGEEYSPPPSSSHSSGSSLLSSMLFHAADRMSDEKSSVGCVWGLRDTTSTRRSPAAAMSGTVRQQSKSCVLVSLTW